MKSFTITRDSKGLRINGELCKIYTENGIVTIHNRSSGTGHSCHPNIDRSGSVLGMIEKGYWDKDCRVAAAGGFIYNISSIVISHDLDLLAFHMEQYGFRLPEVPYKSSKSFVLQEYKEITASVEDLHKIAMDIIDEVMYNKDPAVRKDKNALQQAHRKAFPLEMMAARLTPKSYQPSRAIMFRSAGWIAYHTGLYDEADEMVEEGLQDCVHEQIKQELQELRAAINKATNNTNT